MSHNEHRKRQQKILNQLFTILKDDQHVLGLVFAGSYARGVHDAFSDLDMVCYLRDEQRTGRKELYEQVGKIAPTLCQSWIFDVHALYLFENGVRLDLDFRRPSEIANPSEIYADMIVTYDPDEVLRQCLAKTHIPKPAEHPKWFESGDVQMIDWFFWMFRQVVCWAKRGAQNDYRAYNKLTNAIKSLTEIRSRLVEMRLWTLSIQDYLSRADTDFALRIAKTYPHFEPEEIIQCAKLLLAEYEYVCPAYCEKTKVEYPANKVKAMYRLVEEYEELE